MLWRKGYGDLKKTKGVLFLSKRGFIKWLDIVFISLQSINLNCFVTNNYLTQNDLLYLFPLDGKHHYQKSNGNSPHIHLWRQRKGALLQLPGWWEASSHSWRKDFHSTNLCNRICNSTKREQIGWSSEKLSILEDTKNHWCLMLGGHQKSLCLMLLFFKLTEMGDGF